MKLHHSFGVSNKARAGIFISFPPKSAFAKPKQIIAHKASFAGNHRSRLIIHMHGPLAFVIASHFVHIQYFFIPRHTAIIIIMTIYNCN